MANNENVLPLDEIFEFIMNLVKKCGVLISSRNFTHSPYGSKRGSSHVMCSTDIEIEDLLIKSILEKYPKHKFIVEESTSSGADYSDDPTWIIDPVGGVVNFVHAFPHSCISIALYVNKIAEIGIIHNPTINQTFRARRGKGAYYNDRKMNVRGEKLLSKALIISEFDYSRNEEKLGIVNRNFDKFSRVCHGLRALGSAALNMTMVALGSADANYEMGLHVWDMAAACLMVREAGGVVIDPSGGEFDIMSRRVLAASTIELAKEISKNLTQYYPMPRDDEIVENINRRNALFDLSSLQ